VKNQKIAGFAKLQEGRIKKDKITKDDFQQNIGGVFINGDRDMGSFCSFKGLEHHNLVTKESTALMSNFSVF
jgi:hypothetical protein